MNGNAPEDRAKLFSSNNATIYALVAILFALALLTSKIIKLSDTVDDFNYNYAYTGFLSTERVDVYNWPNRDIVDYDGLVDAAFIVVIRDALKKYDEIYLQTDQHLYITFKTTDPNVVIPRHLQQQYPETITVVLEHLFYDLDVFEDRLAVTLEFDGKSERLTIPFSSITIFHDPTVGFRLTRDPAVRKQDNSKEKE